MLSLQDRAEGWASMAGGKLGGAAGRGGGRGVPEQWRNRGELRAGECGGGHEDEGLDRGEEAHGTAARTSGGGHGSRRKLRATKSTDAGMLKCEHVELRGGRARAGGPFILDLGRGSGLMVVHLLLQLIPPACFCWVGLD